MEKGQLRKERRERDGEEEHVREKTSRVVGRGNALASC